MAGAQTDWNDGVRGGLKSNCIERASVPDYGVFNWEVI